MNADNLLNSEAEWGVVAAMVTDSNLIAELVGTQLEADDFVRADARVLYATCVESYYADLTVEPLTIAERVKNELAQAWGMPVADVPTAMLSRVHERDQSLNPMEHAAIVQRLSTARRLLVVANAATGRLAEGKLTPEEIAGMMSTEALAVTSGTQARAQIDDWMSTGTALAKHLRDLKRAKDMGIEMSVMTGYPFVDDYTRGIFPQELLFVAGAPGVGKSAFAWCCAQGFAEKQMVKAPEQRVGTLIVSMEMGKIASATRLAQAITDINGMRLRAGEIDGEEYRRILMEWKARDGLPIYFNYASNWRVSQLRALVVEAIRRYNVGFVVIDHFRQIDPDRPIKEANDADEVKVRFLKESIAKDLDVAVLCLAHTIKIGRAADGASPRPRLADLRGSGQIGANADFVAFLHKPGKYLNEEERLVAGINDTDMEILWEKARHTEDGMATFKFMPRVMKMEERY